MRRSLQALALFLFVSGCFAPNQMPTESSSSTSGEGTGGPGSATGVTTSGSGGTSSAGFASDTGSDSTAGTTTANPASTGRDSSTTFAEDTGDPTTGGACSGACIELGPEWMGPVSLETPKSGCGEGVDPAFTLFSGLNAPDAECGCSCAESNVVCPGSGVIANKDDLAGNCALVPSLWEENVGSGCNDIPDATDPTELRFTVNQPANLAVFSCEPEVSTNVPDAGWGVTTLGCAEDAAAGTCELCGDQVSGLCIWALGDVACDVPAFQQKSVLFEDFSDERGCTECSCGQPSGQCSGTVQYRTNDTCGLGSVGEGEAGECIDTQFARSANVSLTSDFACEPSVVLPTGSATATGAVTVCCAL